MARAAQGVDDGGGCGVRGTYVRQSQNGESRAAPRTPRTASTMRAMSPCSRASSSSRRSGATAILSN
ncbi:hypothetical protein PAHAL_1G290600 [Panicum hallii]|uniref:Uncharacterized protein n=1 Tax=Panicum hallii TaxID=206008 RepID=A0A2S3GQH8_9POAL|nr:hypothetical protein PAHAL_1G290600 [Panicum hallii]